MYVVDVTTPVLKTFVLDPSTIEYMYFLSQNQHCRLRQCYLSGAEILQLFSVCVSIWLLLFSVCMACGCCCSSHYCNWVTEPCFTCSCGYSAFLNTTSGGRQQIRFAMWALQPESFLFIYVMLSCLLKQKSSIFIASDHKHLSDMCCKHMFAIIFFLIFYFKLIDHNKFSVVNGTTWCT